MRRWCDEEVMGVMTEELRRSGVQESRRKEYVRRSAGPRGQEVKTPRAHDEKRWCGGEELTRDEAVKSFFIR